MSLEFIAALVFIFLCGFSTGMYAEKVSSEKERKLWKDGRRE